LAGQYVMSKISEARERMSSDRIAREKYVASFLHLIACSATQADYPSATQLTATF
jgi:hypothetical protein